MPSEFKFRALTTEDWKDIDTDYLIGKDGLRLKDDIKDGCYTSKLLDSGISDCHWHRVVLEADIPENSTLTVSFYTSEEKTERDCTSGNWSGTRIFKNAKDALMQVPPGRYVTLRIDFHREGIKSPVLKQVKVYYQRLSYLRYLPAAYRENTYQEDRGSREFERSREFLERFLSIFESALYDSEETISRIPMYLDPKSAPEDFYRWLAGWLSLDLYDLLDEDKKREFILRAVEFYKQKGTLSGIASLVSFLTGKKCCIKEYVNNVFRSYGMEHFEDYGATEEGECRRFYRKTSTTVNTKDPDLISNIGGYDDEVHYVMDTGKSGRYSPHAIGIFIFIPSREREFIIEPKQLLKIINSFLPVFVRAEIIIVEEIDEVYYISDIIDSYDDDIHAAVDELFKDVSGDYKDEVNWEWLYAYSVERNGYTNNLDYRTPHNKIGVLRSL